MAMARHQSPAQAKKLIENELKRPGVRGLNQQRKELFAAMQKARADAKRLDSLLTTLYLPVARHVKNKGTPLSAYLTAATKAK